MHAMQKESTDKHKWGREEDFITLNIYSLNITNKKQKIVRLDFFFNVLLPETCSKYLNTNRVK